jgi:hypothetical protein
MLAAHPNMSKVPGMYHHKRKGAANPRYRGIPDVYVRVYNGRNLRPGREDEHPNHKIPLPTTAAAHVQRCCP